MASSDWVQVFDINGIYSEALTDENGEEFGSVQSGVAWDPNGNYLYATDPVSGTLQITEISYF